MPETNGGMNAELYKTIITIVDERVKQIRVTREDFDELKSVVRELVYSQKELAQAQKKSEERLDRVEKAIEELTQAQKRTEERLEELAQAQKRTEVEVRKLAIGLRETRQMVAGLSDTVGFRLEDESYKSLPRLLKRDLNLEVEGRLIRKYVEYADGKVDEVNIYGKGKRNGKTVYILGECKSKLGKRDIDNFLKRVKRLEPVIGVEEKALIAVTYNVMPQVERYAVERGIKVYWSYEL
ncbi:MAG: chordopoxvirus fusion protein [Deltaproteobacteria bacterium]|nr:MAG: chordopoxvirus fusion protein [Deltaproteobacteria bacterium]